ncbi:hypothetical protein HW561_08140 [Rhodobacteraceae bacterium B1Z28]|uniref:Uncharacterized protein n=1 Tax=Ruegeria haliotis TaxID=2747601 RepID=A0ABX2PRC4_9RHOB|nr:hypothetical protein [Ruegeria haliotis]NVO55757.1 hypothetical protein [Ruegeria haliotis]
MSFKFTRKPLIVAALALTTALAACAAPHPAYEDAGYLNVLDQGNREIAANPNYVRLPIDTDAQTDQFIDLSYSLYNGEITKQQFTSQLQAAYPDPKYKGSIRWNADNFAQ